MFNNKSLVVILLLSILNCNDRSKTIDLSTPIQTKYLLTSDIPPPPPTKEVTVKDFNTISEWKVGMRPEFAFNNLFIYSDLIGDKIINREYLGKTTVLNFWFVKCVPCIKEIPNLNKLVEKYKSDQSVVFIAPTYDNDQDILEFFQNKTFKYNIVRTKIEENLSKGILSYPANVIINKEGYISHISFGYSDKILGELSKAIEGVVY